MTAELEGRVLALARRGTGVAQIARRTRTSHDLVAMLIATRGRQEVPGSAASASPFDRVGRFVRYVMQLEVDI